MKHLPAVMIAIVLSVFCSCSDDNNVTGTMIGPEGGTVTGAGGVLLQIPAGALDHKVEIWIETATGSPAGFNLAGGVYEFGPAGTVFAEPVEIKLPYDESSVQGPESGVRVWWALSMDGDWAPLEGSADTTQNTATGLATHFSFGAPGEPETCQPDCAGRECGPDGCGDTCPPGCGAGETCNESTGTCECAPDCTDKQCGDDGCGGDCGTCGAGQLCSPAGACVDCLTEADCLFLQLCTDGLCQDAYSAQAPFCDPCYPSGPTVCGDRSNRCVMYHYTDDPFGQVSDYYCAPDCYETGLCPNGFECSAIVTVKQSDLCQSDADCPGGLPCLGTPGEMGFCPCHDTHNPCSANTCLQDSTCGTATGTCLMIDLPCTQDSDCNMCSITGHHCLTDADCRPILCEPHEGQDYGNCVNTKVCGLTQDSHCPAP